MHLRCHEYRLNIQQLNMHYHISINMEVINSETHYQLIVGCLTFVENILFTFRAMTDIIGKANILLENGCNIQNSIQCISYVLR